MASLSLDVELNPPREAERNEKKFMEELWRFAPMIVSDTAQQ
jgi:hypothetical protein